MREIHVENWEQFESQLTPERLGLSPERFSSLLFRGERYFNWPLRTTLERYKKEKMTAKDYYRRILKIKPEIEVCTGTEWVMPEYPEILAQLEGYDNFSLAQTSGKIPAYEYMAYLRHHGFPSPLLDWTASPYIAAYFAFSKAEDGDDVAIYVLSKRIMQTGSNSAPSVISLGPNVKTHRRHFLQQCRYTMCFFFEEGIWRFEHHDAALTHQNTEENFDLLKFKISSKEKSKVLSILDKFNLNAFSLFGSEEGLMETMARQHLSEKKT